jgi:RNA polymerase sigma-70 factor (ECF subfamily)
VGLSIVKPAWTDDDDLVAACLRGDRQAERALFRREYPRVHAMVVRLVGPAQNIDDLVQETFIAAFRSLAQYRREAKLSTWIDRIGVRIVWKAIAARRRTAATPLELVPEPVDDRGTPHERSAAREGLRRLYAVLDRLKPDARAAFALYAIDGRSIAEVAAITGMSTIAAKVRIWRARRDVMRAAAGDAVLAELLASIGTPEAT